MILRYCAWKKASSAAQISISNTCKRAKGTNSAATASQRSRRAAADQDDAGEAGGKPLDLSSLYGSVSQSEKQKRSQERDFLAAVLASAPTKRDAKAYLNTFGRASARNATKGTAPSPGTKIQARSSGAAQASSLSESIRAVNDSPRFIQGPVVEETSPIDDRPHIAIVKLQDPQVVDDTTFDGVAKTLAQLRALGLLSIVVVDCALNSPPQPDWLSLVSRQALRLARAIDEHGGPSTSIVDSSLAVNLGLTDATSPFAPGGIFVDSEDLLLRPLRKGALVVVPQYVVSTDHSEAKLASTNDIILAITRYLSGLQSSKTAGSEPLGGADAAQNRRIAHVDRIIVLDPLGGTPAKDRPNGAHVFLNMAEEFSLAKADIDSISSAPRSMMGTLSGRQAIETVKRRHRENLDLAKSALTLLPSTSSTLLTTPTEAANLLPPERDDCDDAGVFGYVGSVGTRRSQNPLIHNLLTDRPVHSSSLPLGRVKPNARRPDEDHPRLSKTTLLKRGMPVTIYPDPRVTPWVPPRPGAARPRLTDTCIDLPRLVHLIDDSFNRKLDVQHYLDRVNDNLAGIIIAGEYEGGAILTWERPLGLDEDAAYKAGRFVPYLDKFAVLKKSQGAGGVADVVFNAMVRDCFPEGVCWRSRKDNPVNKWYFERSRGTWKLDCTNWAMFWTTPWYSVGDKKIWDYEDVCRSVVPSWADKKHIVD